MDCGLRSPSVHLHLIERKLQQIFHTYNNVFLTVNTRHYYWLVDNNELIKFVIVFDDSTYKVCDVVTSMRKLRNRFFVDDHSRSGLKN